jgi:sirohydrochlorin ferrochelatase
MTPVILLGHGSPDLRGATGLRRLAASVAERLDGVRVEPAFLDHNIPDLSDVCAWLVEDGHPHAVVVPAFLSTAFHVRSDVPAAAAAAQQETGIALTTSEVLGPDPSLLAGIERSLPTDRPVVLAAAGTSDEQAQAAIERLAGHWSAVRGTEVSVGYASIAAPDVVTAIEDLRTRTGREPAVASYVLFDGVLPDRIRKAAGVLACSPPLGDLPETVDLVISRLAEAHAPLLGCS